MAAQKASKYVFSHVIVSPTYTLTPTPAPPRLPQLVVRPPKSVRNKAPRGRTADPPGPPIRPPPPHLLGPRTRLYRPVAVVVAVVVVVGVGIGIVQGRETWDDGDIPGLVRARADGFTAMLQGAAGEDARNAGIRDGLCQDVAFGERGTGQHDYDVSVDS
jgi:hypothetical protein